MTSIALIEPGPTGGPGATGALIVADALRRAGHAVTHAKLTRSRRAIIQTSLFGDGEVQALDGIAYDAVYMSALSPRMWMHIPDTLRQLGIPVWEADRDDTHPLVAYGGQSAMTPEPIAEFVDVVALGDGEITAVALAEQVQTGMPRSDIMAWASGRRGYYVPSIDDPAVAAIERAEQATITPVLLRPGNHGKRRVVEIARGCKSRCAFCPIGWAGGTYREADPQDVNNIISSQAGEGINLYAPDYSSVTWALNGDRMLAEAGCTPKGRDGRLDRTMDHLAAGGEARSFNFGIEGLSGRIRRALGKPLSDDQIIQAMRDLQAAGVRDIKWYMIVGFPGETDADATEFVRVLREVRGTYDGRLELTLTPLQPTPHTPLQYTDGRYPTDGVERAKMIREALRQWYADDGRVWVASQPKGPDLHEHDTALQRAGRDAARYLAAVPGESSIGSGRWREIAADVGWGYEACLNPIGEGDATSWDHIRLARPGTLWRAYQRYLSVAYGGTEGQKEVA